MLYSSVVLAAGLATLAQAFSQPGDQTWGPLLTPDTSSTVTQGKTFSITWDPEDHPTDGVTVSLVLCHGPGSNCVLQDSAIVEKLPASQKSYDWKVPCDLAPGVQSTSTGYGMLIIVDGTGEFQYSTQFTVTANIACGGSGTGITTSPSSSGSPSTTKTSSTASGIVLGPPAYQTSTYVLPTGNLSMTAGPTYTGPLPGTTIIVSTASDGSVWTYGGSTYAVTPTTTLEGGSTLSTTVAPTLTTGGSTGTAAGAATSAAFTGAAGQLGSSVAGMVIAGAVAVFAF